MCTHKHTLPHSQSRSMNVTLIIHRVSAEFTCSKNKSRHASECHYSAIKVRCHWSLLDLQCSLTGDFTLEVSALTMMWDIPNVSSTCLSVLILLHDAMCPKRPWEHWFVLLTEMIIEELFHWAACCALNWLIFSMPFMQIEFKTYLWC